MFYILQNSKGEAVREAVFVKETGREPFLDSIFQKTAGDFERFESAKEAETYAKKHDLGGVFAVQYKNLDEYL